MGYYDYELNELQLNGLWHWAAYPEAKNGFDIID